MKVLFIHRSVGRHLIDEGKLRQHLNQKNIQLDDYNNNNEYLTYANGVIERGTLIMPGDNTNPSNLADFFKSWPNLLDNYDAIMIKSCYPNSHIKNQAQLELIKGNYKTIVDAFASHKQQLVLLTTPPLRPLFTNRTEAQLADDLADWLISLRAETIHVIDLHHWYAEPTGKNKGMLRLIYRRPLPWDNHPNRLAHQSLAPEVAKVLISLANVR